MSDEMKPRAPSGRLAGANLLTRARARVLRETAAALLGDTYVLRGSRAVAAGEPKKIALTFDDGPDRMTPRYIELLDRLSVRATFFLVGYNSELLPETVRALVAAGHEVASHGYTHRPFPTLSPRELVDELIRSTDCLPPAATRRPLVRPPRGATSAASLLRVAAAGYTTLMWSVDSDDCRTTDPRKVEARVHPKKLGAGDIVLMHEGQEWTLEALPAIVSRLRGAGFDFAPVSEILG